MTRMVLLLSVVVLVVAVLEGVAGQDDRGPVNFQPPSSGGSGGFGGSGGGGGGGAVAAGPPTSFPGAPLPGPPPPPPGPGFRCYAGFSVKKAAQNSLRANSKVRFQDIVVNLGGWSPSFSDFQAPCSGIYYFSFHGVSAQNGDFTLQLMRNNQYQVTAYGSRGDYQQASNSVMLPLHSGDIVHLQLEDGIMYEHPGREAYTSFTGYLILPFN